MKKGKATYKPDYLMIPYPVYCDPRLEGLDRNIYGILYWFEHMRDGKCIASNETIAEIASSNTRSVTNSLSRLEKCGYIKRIYEDDSKRNRMEIKTTISFKKLTKSKEVWMARDSNLDVSNDGNLNVQNIKKGNIKKELKKKKEKKNVERSSTDEISIGEIIDAFKEVNPSYKIFFGQDPQRTSAYNLLKIFEKEFGDAEEGKARLIKTIQFLTKSNKMKFAPVITTPSQLERKFGELKAWVDRLKAGNNKGKGMSGTMDDDAGEGGSLQD